MNEFSKTRKLLEGVSPSFCLAKWTQSTLHLHRGHTHSCHHPMTHEIPLSELSATPSALHNTQYKIAIRNQLFKGERPEECDYCWKIEDLGMGHMSDRIIKSAESWSVSFFNEVIADPLTIEMKPRNLEVSFSRACNFKCIYCGPKYSTGWSSEILRHGPNSERAYDQQPEHLVDAYDEHNNPYIRAFWEWWPSIRESLQVFRITGGEPLLTESTFRVFEELEKFPQPHLEFGINSNLGCSADRMQRFMELAFRAASQRHIKQLKIFASLEAMGSRAEYIRHGLDETQFWDHLERLLGLHKNILVTITASFNLLSASTFHQFAKKILELRMKHKRPDHSARPRLDIAFVRNPSLLAANILTKQEYHWIESAKEFMVENSFCEKSRPWGFSDVEIHKMVRLNAWIKSPIDQDDLIRSRAEFYSYISELDRRRGLSFLEVFPEYEDFYEQCKRQLWDMTHSINVSF